MKRTTYELCKRVIETNNYENEMVMREMLNAFVLDQSITQEECDELKNMLNTK